MDRLNPMLKKEDDKEEEKEKSTKYILHKNVDSYHCSKCSCLRTVQWLKFEVRGSKIQACLYHLLSAWY